jgi:hypothetical protein
MLAVSIVVIVNLFGELSIRTNVDPVQVVVNGQRHSECVTPCTLWLRKGAYDVIGTKPGYGEARGQAVVTAGRSVPIDLHLSVSSNLPPTVGQLNIAASSPAGPVVGAQISIDGQTQPDWLTPHTFANFVAGPHGITIIKDGYQTLSQNVNVRAGGDNSFNVNLIPSPAQVGQLTVAANVVGAHISIDGQTQPDSTTPHTFQLRAGTHVVTGSKAGYEEASKEVTVQPGGMGSVILNLRQIHPPPNDQGSLTVTANVTGAQISIDAETHPRWVTPHAFANLKAGPHHVTATKDGYQTASQDVTLPAGGNVNLHFTLTSAPRDVGTSKVPGGSAPTSDHGGSGMVQIITVPSGLQVFIDGQPRGLTPLEITNLEAGHHTYKIVGPPGRESKEGVLDIQDGAYWQKIARWE